MVELQEMIARGRFVFSGAPKRLEAFGLVNGSSTTKDIARKSRRSLESVLNDLQKLADMGLIREKLDTNGRTVKREGATVFEKEPLVRHIPLSYFGPVADTTKLVVKTPAVKSKWQARAQAHIPTELEIIEICKNGEDQLYEFKAPGVDTDKLTREIAGFVHTRNGGVIFYGVDDDGIFLGTDIRRQDFDQKVHNSVRNTISPQPNIEVHERNVLGTSILLIAIPPWDRKSIYQYTKDGRYYIRRGTSIFALKPEEIRSLSSGAYVV
jgi:Schlafen, AlbA_2